MASLDSTLKAFFAALDRKDFDAFLSMVDRNAEGIDEITKGWIRGKSAFGAYVKRVGPEISDIRTRLQAVRTRRLGDVGIATFLARQSYRLSGRKHDLKLAASMVFVRRNGAWKVTVVHMTPLASD